MFISSAQKEFESIRKKLKRQIELVRIGKRLIFSVILVEKRGGDRIRADIREGLDEAAIYVILLGSQSSPTTVAEFDDAWIRGIRVLIYEPKKISKKSGMRHFRSKLRKLGIRAQIPDRAYENEQDVIDHVINDLAEKFGDIAKMYVTVRNTVARKGNYSEPGR